MKWILLPGMDGTGEFFAPFIEFCPKWVEPVVFSYPDTEPMGYDKLFDYVRERLPNEPFLVIAESFSGPVAVRLAAAEPQGMIGAVVSASFVRNPLPRFLRLIAVGPLFSLLVGIASDLGIKFLLAGRDASPEVVALARRVLRKPSPAVLAHRARAALKVDATNSLKRCRLPLLFLAGSGDNLIRAHNIRRLERLRPDVPVVTVNSPHFLLQTRPGEAVEIIEAFLVEKRLRLTPKGQGRSE